MPRGGARPGSGRKPKDRATAALHASRRRSVVRFQTQPGVAAPPLVSLEPVAVPTDLPAKAAAVWTREAPFALAAGTLTVGSSEALALHCRNVVLELKLSKGRTAGGPSHRGMIAAVTAGRLRFGTSPNGRPFGAPKPAADPFAEFDEAIGS